MSFAKKIFLTVICLEYFCYVTGCIGSPGTLKITKLIIFEKPEQTDLLSKRKTLECNSLVVECLSAYLSCNNS